MKVSIIIHSHTGNTRSVAQKLQEKLAKDGHVVDLVPLMVKGDYQPGKPTEIKLESIPNIEQAEVVIFGAPVHGFSLSQVMMNYIVQIKSLSNKKVGCFTTQAFPFAWMGGNRAIGQMKKLCETKGATICGSEVVTWAGPNRDQRIIQSVERLSTLLLQK